MNRTLYQTLLAQIEDQQWEDLFRDSHFVDGGEAIRRQIDTEEDAYGPLCPPSVLIGIVNKLYSGTD